MKKKILIIVSILVVIAIVAVLVVLGSRGGWFTSNDGQFTREFTDPTAGMTPEQLEMLDPSIPTILVAYSWQWYQTVRSDDTTITPQNPSDFVLTFSFMGMVSTTTDCNGGHGHFWAGSPEENSLTIGSLTSTQMACPNAMQEVDYFHDLALVESYSFNREDLILHLSDGGRMIFTLVEPSEIPSTADTTQDAVVDGVTASDIAPDTPVTNNPSASDDIMELSAE